MSILKIDPWPGRFALLLIAAIMACAAVSSEAEGTPAHISKLAGEPQQLVWKNHETAVFRNSAGHDTFVRSIDETLEVGARYRLKSRTGPCMKLACLTLFSLEKE